jgi:hypothetical protein
VSGLGAVHPYFPPPGPSCHLLGPHVDSEVINAPGPHQGEATPPSSTHHLVFPCPWLPGNRLPQWFDLGAHMDMPPTSVVSMHARAPPR